MFEFVLFLELVRLYKYNESKGQLELAAELEELRVFSSDFCSGWGY